MKICAVDKRMPAEMLERLYRLGCSPVAMEPAKDLESAVASHPDMNLLSVKDRRFAKEKTFVRENRGDFLLTQGSATLSYPRDASLNAVSIGNDFLCREQSVCPEALLYAKEQGMNIIRLNQGYVKCNIVVVDEAKRAVITEDTGIAKVLKANGYSVLLLESHAVALHPYPYGFIGGASGNIDDTVVFTGAIEKHPEYEAIHAFCHLFGKGVLSLSDSPLYDYGSILTLE